VLTSANLADTTTTFFVNFFTTFMVVIKENPSPGADRDGLKENLEWDKLNMSQKACAGKSFPFEELLTEIQAERSAMQRLVLAHTQVLKAFSDLYIYLLKGESYSPFTDPMNPPGSNRKSEAHDE